jgi:hypothetical protein
MSTDGGHSLPDSGFCPHHLVLSTLYSNNHYLFANEFLREFKVAGRISGRAGDGTFSLSIQAQASKFLRRKITGSLNSERKASG